MIEYDIRRWFMECIDKDVRVSDDMIKAKAMEIAKAHHLLQGPRPFACSSKWLRRIKSRFGIVNGRFTDFTDAPSRKRDRALGFWAPEGPNSLPEILKSSRQFNASKHMQSTNATEVDSARVSGGSTPSPASGPAAVEPQDDAPCFPHITRVIVTDTPPVDVPDPSLLPAPSYAVAIPSHEILLPQLSIKPYTLDWPDMLELAATVGQDEKYDGMSDVLALDFQVYSALAGDVNVSCWNDEAMSGLPDLPDMRASYLPLVANGSIPPVCAPSNCTVGLAARDDISLDATPFYSPTIDPSQPLSFMWSPDTSATVTPSVDVAVPSIPPTDPSSLSFPQPRVPQEDIDRLAAEMMHWPIEDLLCDVGMPPSQGQMVFPYDAISLSGLTPSQEASSLDALGNTEFLFSST